MTDQTSAHDPLAYVPRGVAFDDWADERTRPGLRSSARASRWPATSRRWSASRTQGAEVFDYGNSLRAEAKLGGYERAFEYPGFVPAYIRPLFCEGRGPFRWAALSGDPADIAATDKAVLDLFPENESLARWMKMAAEKVAFQGLPARICWLGQGERHLAGLALQRAGRAAAQVGAPIVIGRDHLDTGSVASPYRETEAMLDGSDAIADWPLLNAMVNVASGASWVSIHHGGGVGIGRSIHAGQVSVADGTRAGGAEARARPDQRPRHRRHPPRRRGLRPRVRGRGRARRPRADGGMTRYHADFAWLGGDTVVADVLIDDRGRADRRGHARRPARAARSGCAASRCPASPTRTRTRSSGRCAGARSAAAAASGRGGRTCTRWPGGSRRTTRTRWPRAPTRRWCGPGSRAWGSSTTCTTARR